MSGKTVSIVTCTSVIVIISALFAASSYFLETRLKSTRKSTLKSNTDVCLGINETASVTVDKRPRVWIKGNLEAGYLNVVMKMFDKLGYKRVNGSAGEQWDVLWSHGYPFRISIKDRLKPHQRVNHFPAAGRITSKVNLATSEVIGVPKAFSLPRDKNKFLDYIKDHPDKLWVQKRNTHRGIQVVDVSSMNFSDKGFFVQEFIHNPLLIDDMKFDIGVYVVMTSAHPLRVYFLDEGRMRFAPKPYSPFNASDPQTYTVGSHYTPIWKISSLKQFMAATKENNRESLNAYVRTLGKDPDVIWKSIETIISDVYIKNAARIAKGTQVYGSSRQYFELVRFDFMLDSDLNVYLMEANLSPNLTPGRNRPLKSWFDYVVFNTFSVAGLANAFHGLKQLDVPFVEDKDLVVFNDLCLSDKCRQSCYQLECRVCLSCLSPQLKTTLKDAIIEHRSRWDMKRLIPSQKRDTVETGTDAIQKQWFQGKCQQDISWCS